MNPFRFGCTLLLLSVVLLSSCRNKREVVVEEIPPAQESEILTEAPSSAKDVDSLFAIYERGVCYGMCPNFDLKIYKDGEAIYEGKRFVDSIGFYHTTFDKTSLQKLTATVNRIGYFSMQDTYDNRNVTDLPTVTTGFWDGKKMKTVADRYKGPDELEELYKQLDEMIKGAKWKPLENRKK